MKTTLKNYLVAFIDILGFKEMVRHDTETSNGKQKYIDKLYQLHTQTKDLEKTHPEIQVFQFSDSVVISLPYNANQFMEFCQIIANYQYHLFLSGILCRGGISYGKHFSSDSFMFSAGMIDAYYLESKAAVTPRIVISHDLIELIFPDNAICTKLIIKENDSLYFVSYFHNKDMDKTYTALKSIIPNELHTNASIRQKQIWLVDYYNYCFPIQPVHTVDKFNLL